MASKPTFNFDLIDDDFQWVSNSRQCGEENTRVWPRSEKEAAFAWANSTDGGTVSLSRRAEVQVSNIGKEIVSKGESGSVYHNVMIKDDQGVSRKANMWRSNLVHLTEQFGSLDAVLDAFADGHAVVANIGISILKGKPVPSVWVSHLTRSSNDAEMAALGVDAALVAELESAGTAGVLAGQQ